MRKFPGKHGARGWEKRRKKVLNLASKLYDSEGKEKGDGGTQCGKGFSSPLSPIWQICSHQKKMKNECSFIWHGIFGKEGVLLLFGSSIFLLLLSKVEIEGASLRGVFSRHTHTPFFQITQTFFSPTLLLHFQRSKKRVTEAQNFFFLSRPENSFRFSTQHQGRSTCSKKNKLKKSQLAISREKKEENKRKSKY